MMNNNNFNQYSHRLATIEDAKTLAPLMAEFAIARESADPSMLIKPKFDFEKYVTLQLSKPNSYAWVLEYQESEETDIKTIVVFLFVYTYDEAPPANLPPDLIQHHEQENPFQPRRVGSVLGLYVQPEHRQPEAIQEVIKTGIAKGEELKVTDIDILVSAEQTGIHSLLKRSGFTKAAVQYTRHYDIPLGTELPDLHPPHPELADIKIPSAGAIPLRDPYTNEIVRNPAGDPVFMSPLLTETGEQIKTSTGLPIYPTPVRDPQQNDWVFDAENNLVVCPVLLDENNQVVEYQGIPQFHPPSYEYVDGSIRLKKDAKGHYIFSEVERDKNGKILRSPEGMPVFRQLLLR